MFAECPKFCAEGFVKLRNDPPGKAPPSRGRSVKKKKKEKEKINGSEGFLNGLLVVSRLFGFFIFIRYLGKIDSNLHLVRIRRTRVRGLATGKEDDTGRSRAWVWNAQFSASCGNTDAVLNGHAGEYGTGICWNLAIGEVQNDANLMKRQFSSRVFQGIACMKVKPW